MESWAHYAIHFAFANVTGLLVGAYAESRLGWMHKAVRWAKSWV